MSPQRYAAINQEDEDHEASSISPRPSHENPGSSPPSFRSQSSLSSTRRPRTLHEDPLPDDADHTLADAFDDGTDSDTENNEDVRQRLVRSNISRPSSNSHVVGAPPQAPVNTLRRVTQLPSFTPVIPQGTLRSTNDGVFANLSAKPTAGETLDDKPPTYEQAAADATPPYWETTILAPGMSSDDVYINGLPVGSVFSFIWNGMISMSFLFPGFLLTYLLHTTHAAKNGSLAGLGMTLVQYGFYMRGGKSPDDANPGQFAGAPPDPNSHNFDPKNPTGDGTAKSSSSSGFQSTDFISYGLMIIGWFLLIRAVSSFLRARREEQLVLQSPARGLAIPVVAEGEGERAA